MIESKCISIQPSTQTMHEQEILAPKQYFTSSLNSSWYKVQNNEIGIPSDLWNGPRV